MMVDSTSASASGTHTDRSLLELAAKAAGITVQRSRLDDPLHRDFLIDGECARNPGQRSGPWNPLTDDGDALRLAVKLDLSSIMVFEGWGDGKRREFWSPNSGYDGGKSATTEAEYSANPCAATRRAIVRAAAAIGECSMPKPQPNEQDGSFRDR